MKASWKLTVKQEHFIDKNTQIRHTHLYKNQISWKGISFNKTSAHLDYTYKLLTSIYEIQTLWRHLIQFELIIGSLSFRQPIHVRQYKFIRDLIRFSLFKYLGRRVCIRRTLEPPYFVKIALFLFVQLVLLRISCPLKFGYPTTSRVQWCFLLVMQWVHVWTSICTCTVCMTGYIVEAY